MNKDKISAQDVIEALASKAGITKHMAEDFFKAFITSVEEALLANDSVKIKDLGTFKLIWIAPRKSVNVNTGEDIIIDGYYKVVFTSDKELKELVNQPFAHLEAVVLDEPEPDESKAELIDENAPLSTLNEQANEIKGLLSEIQSMTVSNADADGIMEVEIGAEAEDIIVEKDNPAAAPPSPKTVKEEKAVFVETEQTTALLRKKKRTWLWILSGILSAAAVIAIVYFAYMPAQHWMNKNIFGYDTEAYDAVRERAKLAEERFNESRKKTIEAEAEETDEFQSVFENRLAGQQYITTETLRPGSRLAFLAEKHYGSPYFWVYIYEANMDKIPNPNNVKVGTVVRIPRLDKRLIDLDNPKSMEKALLLHDKYLGQQPGV